MSLINQMLKDLEQRRRRPAAVETNTLKDGQNNRVQLDKQLIRKYALWGVGGLLIVELVMIIVWLAPTVPAPKPKPVVVMSVPSPALLVPSKAPELSVLARAIGVTGDAANSQLTIYLNKVAHYNISSDLMQNTITLTLDNTQMAEPLLPLNNHQNAITDVQAVSVGTQLKVTLTLLPDVVLQGVNFDESTSPKLILSVANKNQNITGITPLSADGMTIDDASVSKLQQAENVALQSNSGMVIKTAMTQMSQQDKDATWQHALDLIQNNQVPEAMNVLNGLLNEAPDYVPARTALATLLLQQGKTADAEQLVIDGLRIQPNSPALTKLAAQIFMLRGDAARALAMLQTATPAMTTDPEYYSFMAALYQRLGQPQQAAKLYDQLVGQYPNNAILWLGFATSLESLGKTKAAREAYQNAEVSGGLSMDLQRYVESRIHAL